MNLRARTMTRMKTMTSARGATQVYIQHDAADDGRRTISAQAYDSTCTEGRCLRQAHALGRPLSFAHLAPAKLVRPPEVDDPQLWIQVLLGDDGLDKFE